MGKLRCLLLTIIACASSADAATLLVPSEFPTIQEAVDQAKNGDTVLVAPGRYETNAPLIFNRSLPARQLTLRSEAGAGATVLARVPKGGSPSVVSLTSSEVETTVLEGFTLTTTTTSPSMSGFGGAILSTGSSAQVKDCRIVGNGAELGGAIYCRGGSPTFVSCTIERNIAQAGGAIYCEASSPTLTDCRVQGNTFDRHGALYFKDCPSVNLLNCRISENRPIDSPSLGGSGGGVLLQNTSAVLSGCRIQGNSALFAGGIDVIGGSLKLEGCAILDNVSTLEGSAIRAGGAARVSIIRSTISGNCSGRGGAVDFKDSPLTLESSIVWDNGGGLRIEAVRLTSRYSCLQGPDAPAGTGNINADPKFCGWGTLELAHVDSSSPPPGDGSAAWPFSALSTALAFGYGLSRDSPCIGTGAAGVNMGADLGTCDEPPVRTRRIDLAAGSYRLTTSTLIHHASLEGAGAEKTSVEGTIWGLRTGALVARLRVTAGTHGGVVVSAEEPEIREVVISENGSSFPLGGGLSFFNGGGRVIGCTVTRTDKGQGAVYLEQASPVFTDCSISENSTMGVFCSGGSSPLFKHCDLSNNSPRGSEGRGGGIHSVSSSPTLEDCSLSGNSSWGAAFEGGKPILLRCVIGENIGGGVSLTRGSAPLFTACAFDGNRSPAGPAAFFCEDSSPGLSHCSVTHNVAHTSGAVLARRSSLLLDHCTVAGNVGATGGIHLVDSNAGLRSSIIWGNSGPPFRMEKSSRDVSRSCIEESEPPPGPGNLNVDPRFCGWTGPPEVSVASQADFDRLFSSYGFGLSKGSPCQAAGENGSDMGADLGTCDAAVPTPRILLLPGNYQVKDRAFPPGLNLEGAGEASVLLGSVLGLRSGDRLANLKVTGGDDGVVSAPGGSPRLEHCIIVRNSGSGVRCAPGSSPILEECTIAGNQGTGLFIEEGSKPAIRRCTISGNEGRQGGGIHCRGSAPIFEDCLIADNSAGVFPNGGGVYCENEAAPSFTRCDITRNIVGIYSVQSSPGFDDCTIRQNEDGGISISGGGAASFRRCEVSFNRAGANRSAGLFCGGTASVSLHDCLLTNQIGETNCFSFSRATVLLDHCTISGNVSDRGPVLSISSSDGVGDVRIADSIFWGNVGGIGVSTLSRPEFSHSCIEGDAPRPGTGNIDRDPLFCGWGDREEVHVDGSRPGPGDGSPDRPFGALGDALAYRYGLSALSPCRGAGSAGGDMGANRGRCDAAGTPRRRILLAAGVYPLGFLTFVHHAGAQGAGPEESVLQGTVRGLQSGEALSHLKVTSGAQGGIVIAPGQAPEVVGVTVSGNAGPFSAGGIFVQSAAPSIRACIISENFGGGLRFIESSGEVIDCLITRNFAGNGGGVSLFRSTTKISRCVFSQNEASNVGGGLEETGTGVFQLDRCVFAGNRALEGGAARSLGLRLSNCLLVANRAQTGGAISVPQGSLELISSTVVSNEAATAGGVLVPTRPGAAQVLIRGSILWGNGGSSLEGIASVSHSLIEGPAPWPGPGNVSGDPRFRSSGTFDFTRSIDVQIAGKTYSLPDFIVEQGDHRLRPNSPGIDAGDPADGAGVDLDGNARTCGAGVDLGAYELCLPDFLRGEVNGDAARDTTDVVVILGYLFLGQSDSLPCLKSADVDDNGTLDLSDPINLLGYLYLGGPPPPEPFQACGSDPSEDDLDCILVTGC